MRRLLYITLLILASCVEAFAQVSDTQKAASDYALAIAKAQKATAVAPKPVYWSNSLMTQFNFSQTSYTNWAKGGNNSLALSCYVDGNANYAKGNLTWKNRFQFDYGFLYSADKPIVQKNRDRILVESTWGHKAAKKFNYSAKFTFLSQFAPGYDYGTPTVENPTIRDWKDSRTHKSGFLSPATINLGIGIDWNPSTWLSVNVAPLTGGFTIVTDENFRKNYSMDIKPEYKDLEEILPYYYRSARFEFGAQLTADAKLKINNNLDFTTHLLLFSNYLKNPEKIRTNWDNRLIWRLSKLLTLTLTTNLIYDDFVLIVDKNHPEGHKAIQFQEGLQIGFTYNFARK